MNGDYFWCRIEGCDWWVVLGGYTVKSVNQMKSHVIKSHSQLSPSATRRDGGVVDQWVAGALRVLP